ncbi:hypothetical protein [Mesorhizobium sp. M1365]|uniref:hypothetical protein n=1 Tax=Mesorhizobium sp. M1365 TaxID=2957090 RepID=UPI003335A5DC
MRKYVLLVGTLLICGGPTFAQPHKCIEAKDAGYNQISAYYDPRIDQVNEAIKQIVAKGGDPNSVAIKVGEKFYTLPEISAKLARDKQIGAAAVDKLITDCEQQVKPYQDVINAFVDVQTLGIAKLLPGKMGFVDASDILAGYPLGGPDALIPKARDDILNAIGIGGKNNDLGKIIKDPLRPLKCIFGC